jgi:uncharacterized protein YbjT (DUF2867 family)
MSTRVVLPGIAGEARFDTQGESIMSKTILITGATGNISSGILAKLKDSGHSLRALVRNPAKAEALSKQGVDVRIGDLEKPWTLDAAFAGVDSLWLLTAGDPRGPEQNSNAIWAARKAGVKHVVRMSAVGAAYDAPAMSYRLHALSDAELIGSGIPYTIVKAQFFAQNFVMAADPIKEKGCMFMSLGDGKIGIIDARDISEFAAHVLTTEGHEGKTYALTGPASLNMHQVAEAIGAAIGKPIQYVAIPVGGVKKVLAEKGMDEWAVHRFGEIFDAYAANKGDIVTDDFQRVLGKAPRSIERFAQDFAGVFGKK